MSVAFLGNLHFKEVYFGPLCMIPWEIMTKWGPGMVPYISKLIALISVGVSKLIQCEFAQKKERVPNC